MELNTPNKDRASSTSLSQFEDSPVFNFINNLSPIELVKSRSIDPTLNSLSFASPPSVFASPQLNSQRESKFVSRRCQSLDPLKSEVSQSKDDNNMRKGLSEAAKESDLHDDQSGNITSQGSDKNVNIVPPDEHLELALELPKGLKCDCASPDGNIMPLGAVKADTELNVASNSNERGSTYSSEKDLRKIYRVEKNEGAATCDWVALISDVDDMLNFNSSFVEEQPEEQKAVDPGTISFVSNVLQTPQGNAYDLENIEAIGCCVDSSEKVQLVESGNQSIEYEKQKEGWVTTPIVPGSLFNKIVVNEATEEVDIKGKCCKSGCKKHKIRRRCLLFEMGGAHKRKSVYGSSSGSSVSSPADCKIAYVEKHLTSCKTGKARTLSTLSGRGFGLHLNALATTSSDGKVVEVEAVHSGEQGLSIVPYGNEDKVMEIAPQTSTGVGEDFGISSPKTKRHKVELVGAACKRCNCKRSKCLKLYCECFAAGLYCIEPCSCQDCFNNPAHEGTVLETRKQIESRNPLAFAPKVIIGTDTASEFGDENNKTPASARHKRGCNCKKSSCLKKYCECFQGGVGCSSNCRCEGCKNAYGSKSGFYENEGEQCEAYEKNASDVTHEYGTTKDGDKEHPDRLIPSETARSPMQASTTIGLKFLGPLSAVEPSTHTSNGQKFRTDFFCRQPKFDRHLQAIPEDDTPEILTGRCSPTTAVKSTSPNCKRISPPHHHGGSSTTWRTRKLILRSVPPFPSLNSQ